MVDERLAEQIWSLHCLGNPVSAIAGKLCISEAEVREAIFAVWQTIE